MASPTQPTPQPTSAPIVEVELGGKKRKILMGFRAYKKLELNPFKNDEIKNFMTGLDIDKAAAFVQAGMENAALVLQTEAAPTIEEVIDMLDVYSFNAVMMAINSSVTPASAPVKVASGADPQKAQTGSRSGPSGAN